MDSSARSERCRPRVEPAPEAMRLRILGRVAGAFFAAPLCLGCGVDRADTGWLISPMGIVHGLCFKCASGMREPTVAAGNATADSGSSQG
jgi:hypothetical protein